jgi:hypothetical protein
MVLVSGRPIVAGMGVSRPSGPADGAAGVRATNTLKRVSPFAGSQAHARPDSSSSVTPAEE